VDPPPPQRYRFSGSVGVTVYFEDVERAVDFYSRVLGSPPYAERDDTRGWPIGDGWLTLLKGDRGNPRNVEITLELERVEEAEALQRDFLAAGATGPAPSDQLMYRPLRYCPVVDPFGLEVLIVAPIP
jgi:uncharacterized glyoxalase superfamily protein PhnB